MHRCGGDGTVLGRRVGVPGGAGSRVPRPRPGRQHRGSRGAVQLAARDPAPRAPAESAFADTLPPARPGQPRLSACPPPGSHDAANLDNDALESHGGVAAKLGRLTLGRPAGAPAPAPAPAAPARPRPASSPPALLDAELRFHCTRGPDVSLSADRRLALARPDGGRTLVFCERPLRPGESLCVQLGRPGLAAPGALAFGITSCDPGGLRPAELPADPDALLDRKEYWVVARAGPVPSGGDALSFTLRPGGDVLLGVNGRPRGRLLCVDTTRALWAFFAVRGGAAGQLRLLGTLQTSPATSPSGSLSGSQDDSDSDMALSVNHSSSASESSLVTAPSSPLSPPVSPVFAPEPAGGRSSECTVCFDGEVDTVIYTCGHMCLCHGCGQRLKRQPRACCPICRRPLKDVIKIYRP